ncbi:MAG: hypothetical protein J2P37_03500 [Ktedonobacteraceae bacterium]|nr:hypothetical protein [Ktedonobacteraceae bacterium]MBO0795494.1 hypothetical protein [Ktedonobacteraceae bacterium]
MRIQLGGGPGSGKTTLAKRIAVHLNVPYYDMDAIGWESGNGALRPLEVRLRDVHEIAIQPAWVVDSYFPGWSDELLEAADHIILLDMPWHIARWRIITRHMRASLAGTNRHRGLRKLYHFLGHAKECYTSAEERQKDAGYFRPYKSKVITCQRPVEVEAAFQQLIERG